jgi:benzylsuccinate CoA-transferase BbsF subunit
MSEHSILHGVRILDFSWVLAGPYATRLLADFGAEVIKVQPILPEDESTFSRAYYNAWNRNKLGITLNLSKPAGREIVKKLVRISDAVVENFSPRVMANWGLDYQELQNLKPDIIMLSMSVMGHTGPWRNYTGFGPTVQAFCGITSLTAYPGQPPLGLGYSYADHISGLYASLALLKALEDRLQAGKGQWIDLSQTEAMASLLADSIADYTLTGRQPASFGNGSPGAAPHGVYRCQGKDRWCAIAVFSDGEWEGFKRALGHPSWADEELFSTPANRLQNREALDSLIEGWTQTHSAEQVTAVLQKEGVPSGAVQTAADLAADPQLHFRGFLTTLENQAPSPSLIDASPIHLSENPAEYRSTAPARGENNDYVYGRLLGLSEKEINKLRRDGVI